MWQPAGAVGGEVEEALPGAGPRVDICGRPAGLEYGTGQHQGGARGAGARQSGQAAAF